MSGPLRVVRRDGPVIVLDDGTVLALLDDSAEHPTTGDLVTVGEAKVHAPVAELDRLAARGAN